MANNLLYTPFGYYLRVLVPKDMSVHLGTLRLDKRPLSNPSIGTILLKASLHVY